MGSWLFGSETKIGKLNKNYEKNVGKGLKTNVYVYAEIYNINIPCYCLIIFNFICTYIYIYIYGHATLDAGFLVVPSNIWDEIYSF